MIAIENGGNRDDKQYCHDVSLMDQHLERMFWKEQPNKQTSNPSQDFLLRDCMILEEEMALDWDLLYETEVRILNPSNDTSGF